MLISPTEPAVIRKQGQVAALPELHGTDIILLTTNGMVGIQRKEVGDLLSSAQDGRLAEQIVKMQWESFVCRVLIIEGRMQFASDGQLMGHDYGWGRNWSQAAVRGLLWSARMKGVWVERTENITDTVRCLEQMQAWFDKPEHTTLERTRNPASSPWGTVSNRDYVRHLLMGLPDIGPKLADKMIDEFGMPWKWAITQEEVCRVLGPKRGRKVYQVFGVLNGD